MGAVRLFLAISVALGHYGGGAIDLFPGGIAVEMFFMISGFYMSLILSGKYDTGSWQGVLTFYASRFFRLWPVFLLTTLAVKAWWLLGYFYLGRATGGTAFPEAINALAISLPLAFTNIFMIGQDIPCLFHLSQEGARLTFAGAAPMPDGAIWMGFARNIGAAWSIGTEIWFYLLAPALIRRSTATLLAVAGASLALRFWMNQQGLSVYFFTPTHLCLFVAGMLAFRAGARFTRLSHPAAVAGAVAFIVAAGVVFGAIGEEHPAYKWPLYLIFAAMLPYIFDGSKSNAIDRTIGELSYPVYLIHAPMFKFLGVLTAAAGMHLPTEALLAIIIAISYGIYMTIEVPIGRWRHRLAAERITLSPDFRTMPAAQDKL